MVHPMAKKERSVPWCTITEASELLGVSTRTVYRLMKNGELHYRVYGGVRRIPRMALVPEGEK